MSSARKKKGATHPAGTGGVTYPHAPHAGPFRGRPRCFAPLNASWVGGPPPPAWRRPILALPNPREPTKPGLSLISCTAKTAQRRGLSRPAVAGEPPHPHGFWVYPRPVGDSLPHPADQAKTAPKSHSLPRPWKRSSWPVLRFLATLPRGRGSGEALGLSRTTSTPLGQSQVPGPPKPPTRKGERGRPPGRHPRPFLFQPVMEELGAPPFQGGPFHNAAPGPRLSPGGGGDRFANHASDPITPMRGAGLRFGAEVPGQTIRSKTPAAARPGTAWPRTDLTPYLGVWLEGGLSFYGAA
ncbi:hypothetical protein GWK47_025210 [Chionoecetes opilio]|uniref:Uncharacterized protein n=1 Tax=Chionoecetes opilio TaxID=41210 RepID=A0A8J4XLS0_CHIOP|nr:hypothetical protein GWK47_025210 [Chionoecetes opilio]